MVAVPVAGLLQFNGHNWLATKLRKQGIPYKLTDNAFVEIADWKRAQQLVNGLDIKTLPGKLDQFATRCQPKSGLLPHP